MPDTIALWRYTLLGETAWLVTCLLPDLALANRFAFALAQALRATHRWSVVLGLRSVTVRFDPLEVTPTEARAAIQHLGARLEPAPEWNGIVHTIPVRYGGEAGPDLETAARALGIAPEQLIALHTSQPWRVLILGFAPGFAYLGPLPAALHLPRRATPAHVCQQVRSRLPTG